MFKAKIEEDLKSVIQELNYQATDIVLSIPKNFNFGDYTTNIALQLAKQNLVKDKQNPQVIAKKISQKFWAQNGVKEYLEKVEMVDGFINFFLKDQSLMSNLHLVCSYSALVNPEVEGRGGKDRVIVEYTDPNPFKEFHIGHLFSNSIGESLSRLIESTGAEVKRANYFGDVGMHVAKSVWGMQQKVQSSKFKFKSLEKKSLVKRVEFLGEAYVLGAKSYDGSEDAKQEISDINKRIYQKDPSISDLYQKGREWSLEYFETIYVSLGTKFDYYFPESEVAQKGQEIVEENLKKGIFEESEGAVVFPGERFGLHNRVFISSQGLPTYEAKELGLAFKKYEQYPYDISVVVTGNEIKEYFQVLMMALSQIDPDLAKKTTHIPHGMLRMVGGKMSSRKGNVLTYEWLKGEVSKKIGDLMEDSQLGKDEKQQVIDIVSIGAIKFSMLKSSPHMDVTFDLEKSVSLQGDSGPYLQYSYARAKSVLRSASYNYDLPEIKHQLEPEERELLSYIEHFTDVVSESAKSLRPNLVASFLLEFGRTFNLFYQKHPIIKAEEKSQFRLALTCAVAVVLKQGLYLLGIEVPERM